METAEETIIEAVGVSKRVRSGDDWIDILTSVSLTIKSAETVAIVGASGSGKSTLLSLLAGLDHPSEGYVCLTGQRLDRLNEDQRARLRGTAVGFVFQSFQLVGAFTAFENIMVPLELQGVADAEHVAKQALTRVGLEQRSHHYPRQLSGGEQQRVALARAFVSQPRVLFADEPTGNLDRRTGTAIIDLLFELNRERTTTLVLVTHDEHLAARCDRIVHLADGRIQA